MVTSSAPTEIRGLTESEVEERRRRGQVNEQVTRTSRTVGEIVRANVFTRFNALLGSLLVVILAVGDYQDAVFGLVLVANTLIGIVQELRAKRTLDRLTVLVAPKARLRRDGITSEAPTDQIVLDDVLELRAGDQVPVDGEMLHSRALELDESLLTGESDPLHKPAGTEVLSGSFAVAGSGIVRATRVGADSFANRLALEGRRFTVTPSELRGGVDRILGYVTIAIIPCAILLTVNQARTTDSMKEAVSGAVAGIVAMVPEGLVLLTSMAFALAVIRLGRRHALVQELQAVEMLARVDTVCVDKTGTLTEGMIVFDEVVPVGGSADGPGDETAIQDALEALAGVEEHPNSSMRAISDGLPASRVDGPKGDEGREYEGDPGDHRWQPVLSVPFSSARKWSGATFAGHGVRTDSWVLGAPEIVGEALSWGTEDGTEDDGTWREQVSRFAADGKRVLLLAQTDVEIRGDHLPAGLRARALVLLAEQVRSDAAETLDYFDHQGVAVKVISGDNPTTVAAIAREVEVRGSRSGPTAEPVDVRDLEDDPERLRDIVNERVVFGRVTPQGKRTMVDGMQAYGSTVAMTGDGVNDVLAMKDADLGIAMGAGTEAARSVAQVVLLDNHFSSLPHVVAEGRRVIANVELVATMFLAKTVYAILFAVVVALLAVPYPFLPRHLTIVGSLAVGIPGFFLSLAPNTTRARPGFLQRILPVAIPSGIVMAAITLGVYAIAQADDGADLDQARTAATFTLTLLGLWLVVIVSRPLTWWKVQLVVSMVALLFLTLAIPVVAEFYALESPPPEIWAIMGVSVLAGSALLEIVNFGARRYIASHEADTPQAADERTAPATHPASRQGEGQGS